MMMIMTMFLTSSTKVPDLILQLVERQWRVCWCCSGSAANLQPESVSHRPEVRIHKRKKERNYALEQENDQEKKKVSLFFVVAFLIGIVFSFSFLGGGALSFFLSLLLIAFFVDSEVFFFLFSCLLTILFSVINSHLQRITN